MEKKYTGYHEPTFHETIILMPLGLGLSDYPYPMNLIQARRTDTLDIGAGGATITQDFTKPFPAATAKKLAKKYGSIVCMCCTYDVFVQGDGKGIVLQAWKNARDILSSDGVFTFSVAFNGLKSLFTFFQMKGTFPSSVHSPMFPKVRDAVHRKLARYMQKLGMFRAMTKKEVVDMYVRGYKVERDQVRQYTEPRNNPNRFLYFVRA